MQVNRIATMVVETAHPDDSVEVVARTMAHSDAGFLPVVEEGRLIGVVTDRDLVVRIIADGLDPRYACVREAMSQPALWIYGEAEHAHACRMMMDHGVRRLVVCDHHRRPVGVLSLDDLALFGHGDETVGRVLEHVVAPRIVQDVLG